MSKKKYITEEDYQYLLKLAKEPLKTNQRLLNAKKSLKNKVKDDRQD